MFTDIKSAFPRYYYEAPLNFDRAGDRTVTGRARKNIHIIWDLAMKSMIRNEMKTRKEFFPVLEKRMANREASLKYILCKMEDLVPKFPGWDEVRVLDLHDLFQVFEVDGDGLIEVSEMCVGLDNLGDMTPMDERVNFLCSFDDDGTGNIDFEEFLEVHFKLQNEGYKHPIGQSFKMIESNMRFIRSMSSVQRIQTGFF